jgi:hypothetical protein
MLRPGDTFATPLPNGLYGALRVLRVRGNRALIGVSRWIGERIPTAAESSLLVELTSGIPGERYQAAWNDATPSAEVTLIGNFPVSKEHAAYDTEAQSVGWPPFMGAVVLVREGRIAPNRLWPLVNEALAARAPVNEDPAYPHPLDLEVFWKLIEQTSPSTSTRRLVSALARLDPEKIRGFHERLTRLLFAIDGVSYASHGTGVVPEYISPDLFLYQRCYAVAQGKAFYEAVMADPRKMPNEECEDLAAAALIALGRAAGGQDELPISTTVSFETYSNQGAWVHPRAHKAAKEPARNDKPAKKSKKGTKTRRRDGQT